MGEFVDHVVVFVGAVAFDPVPSDVLPSAKAVDVGPEVGVGFLFPALIEGLDDEVGVAIEVDFEILEVFVFCVEVFERFDDRLHFHAVVGGVGLVAADRGFLVFFVDDECGPTAGAGIADAGAVGIDCDFH